MKATGIIRRIDDLGRVVIPKEIRRALKIEEGDPLEIFVKDDTVCFKVYRQTEQLKDELEGMLNEKASFLNDNQIKAFNTLIDSLRG